MCLMLCRFHSFELSARWTAKPNKMRHNLVIAIDNKNGCCLQVPTATSVSMESPTGTVASYCMGRHCVYSHALTQIVNTIKQCFYNQCIPVSCAQQLALSVNESWVSYHAERTVPSRLL